MIKSRNGRSVIQTTVFCLDMSITEIMELEAYQIYVLVKKKVYPEVNILRRRFLVRR